MAQIGYEVKKKKEDNVSRGKELWHRKLRLNAEFADVKLMTSPTIAV